MLSSEQTEAPVCPAPHQVLPVAAPRNGRLVVMLGIGGLLLLLTLFHGTANSIYRLWMDDSAYSHGLLILPIVAWLIWDRRHRLSHTVLKPAPWALLPLCAIGAVWLAAQIISIQVVSQFALVALADCLVLVLIGAAGFRVLLFPLLFLFAAVPIGQGLTPQLQAWTANIAVTALRVTGMPVFQDGLQISTPIGNFAVADECSGLRFLTATLTLGILFASEFYTSWRRRFAFIALALAIPVFANGLRVFTVILLARTFGMEFAASVDHVIYGWIFLSIVTGVLLLIGWSFREPAAPVRRSATPREIDVMGSRRVLFAMAACCCVVLGGVSWAAAAAARDAMQIVDLDLPATTAPLDAAGIQGLPWQPDLPGADARRVDRETVSGQPVIRVVAYYAWQRQGAKVASDAAVLAPDDWVRLGFGTAAAAVDGQHFAAQRLLVAHGRQRWLIYSWYWVDGRFTGSALSAKLFQIEGLLRGRNAGATIVMATPFDENQSAAQADQTLTLALDKQQGLSSALTRAGGI